MVARPKFVGQKFAWRVLAATGAVIGAACAASAIVPPADVPADTVQSPVRKEAVQRGRTAYMQACAACHGAKLEGRGGPALAGPAFLRKWIGSGRIGELHEAVERMPKQAPGSLPKAVYADITAYLLDANGTAPGKATPVGPAKPTIAQGDKAEQLPSAPPSVSLTTATGPSDAEVRAAAGEDWLGYNRDLRGTRYSTLDQINAGNAAQLQPVCLLQTGAATGFQSSPLFYHGVGYASTVYEVFAFDAATCERKWTYTYALQGVEMAPANRGIVLYDGKIFRGTSDGHLLALDAATGSLLWDAHVSDSAKGASVSSAPVAYGNRVYVGLSGGELGIRGKIHAFDATSGKLVWTFNTVPAKGEAGYDTWEKGAETGGGASWTSFAFDPQEGLVYAPVGNPGPDFNADARPGHNLYTNSVVALDAATGKIRWYVQQAPADYHDFDTAAPPVLYEQGGRRLMAVGSKDGNVYIYDRDSHAQLARTPVTTIRNVELPLRLGKEQKHLVCPGVVGGVEWYGPAYSPQSQALYVGTVDWCAYEWLEPHKEYKEGSIYLDGSFELTDQKHGWLKALDAATGKELWSYAAPNPMVGGVTPTAGGIVMTGGTNGEFLVFNAKDGRVLYRFNTGGAVGGGVSTYMVGGRQYVAVATGTRTFMQYGVQGSPTLMVFALPPKEGPR